MCYHVDGGNVGVIREREVHGGAEVIVHADHQTEVNENEETDEMGGEVLHCCTDREKVTHFHLFFFSLSLFCWHDADRRSLTSLDLKKNSF